MIPFRGVPFSLVSPHSPEHCAERLQRLIAPDTGPAALLTFFSDKPLLGDASDSTARVRKRNQYRNFMQPQLTAALESYGSGTRLDCRIALPLPSLLLLTLAFVFLTFVSLVALVGVGRGNADVTNVLPIFGVGGFFICLLGVGWLHARGEREFIETTFANAIDTVKEH